MKRNKFSKALKHLKSKKIDEKLKLLDEQPTNRMSGVYQVTPDTGDGFRMGVGDPDRKFYPKADGTWPSGIPADPSDTLYIRKGGYFDSGKGTVPAVQNITPRDLTYNDVTANGKTNTDSFIRPSDGKPYTSLPEGTESFILGPLVGNYAINHGYDDFTNLGYIQKDTRQFVLLGRIQGYFDGTAKRSGNARTFDGTASMFTSFNSNFKLEHALWMKDTYLAGNFVDNFPFNFAGGIPVERHPDDNTMGSGSVHGTNEANEGGENDNIGTPQDPPDDNDIESLNLWGLIKKSIEKFGDFAADPLGAIADFFGDYLTPPAAEYATNIAKSIVENKPIEVKQEDVPKGDIDKLIGGFNDSATWIPISVSTNGTETPYADENFYVDEKGNVNSNIGPNGEKAYYKKDTTGPVDADVGVAGYGNPLAAAGNAQVQVVTGGDGEDYILYTDHAYHNLESDDPGEVPDPIKAGLSWLIHNVTGKGDSTKPNTGGMSGYPPNIKGDVKTEIKIDLNDPRVSDEFRDRVNREKYYKEIGVTESSKSKNRLLKENKVKILREIRQPLKEIKELPKTTKLKGYRPNFKGKFSSQNTPDVTASKISDDIVSAKNSSRQVWTAKDKYWKGYETTERMNIIYDNLGFGSQFFDNIAGKNVQLKKDQTKKVQEHLNMLAHQKAMREVYGVREYENKIEESETFDNKINDPLFTKVAKRLKKEIDYPKKPAAKGYPNEAPPKIDPNTGMHPKFGKRYKYDKLDPISAKTMAGAPTGDPEIDANVKKAAKIKEDWRSDLKNLWLGSERKDWKKKVEENFVNTTQGMKVGQTFTHVPSGQSVTTSGILGGIETLQTSVELFGDAIPGPTESQYGLQGFAKPIDIMRRSNKKTEQLNKELDSSEQYTKEIKADEFMKARLEEMENELDKLKKILDEKTKVYEDLQKRIKYLDKMFDKNYKKYEKIRMEGIKKISKKYDERMVVRNKMVAKFEASFPSLTYTITGSMQILDKADSDRYYATQDRFYKSVDAKWKSMTKQIEAERKAFDDQMAKLYSSMVYKYRQESFVLSLRELPTAKAQYEKALKNHSDKFIEYSELNQHENMIKGLVDEVVGMVSSYFRRHLGGGIPLPVEMTLRYAMGNMDPMTNSPGTLFNALTMPAIMDAYKSGRYNVMQKDYDGLPEQVARAMLNRFNYEITPNGIRVMDIFNFNDPEDGGANIGAFAEIPGAQWIATQLVKAGDRKARSRGLDPRDDRFGIKVDYTIPKSDMTPEQIKLFYGKSKASTNRTGYGYDTKGKLDSSGYGMDPNRDTETQARPIKPSKTVNKIKGLAGEKARKELSLDQPIVSPKKKKS